MGKKRHQRSPSSSDASLGASAKAKASASPTEEAATKALFSETDRAVASGSSSLVRWLSTEWQGAWWVIGCAIVGALLGFGIGTGHLTGAYYHPVSPWRKALGIKVRRSATYQFLTLRKKPWAPVVNLWQSSKSYTTSRKNIMGDPSNPMIFYILREAIEREQGGEVHRDLGMLVPAPCGAARGIGMVRDSFTRCQERCFPGNTAERLQYEERNVTVFQQDEVLMSIPLNYQMTRHSALETLNHIITDAHKRESLLELDDAALLVMFLAHERGHSRISRWLPYIASLPTQPSCGYSQEMRPYMLDAIAALSEQLGVDTNGWPRELAKASQYADKIAMALSRDYGAFLKSPEGVSSYQNIQWALCQVASRATAGSEQYGALRLVPLMDMINHDVNAGGFIELTGKEALSKGDFVDASEDDIGAFVVRSLRHGRRKPLKKGQELLVNYNVPAYSPLDWFISLGFVPPERWQQWQKIDSALPRVRRDGPFASNAGHPAHWMTNALDQDEQSSGNDEL